MASGSAAGCIVDAVGGSNQGTLPAIVGAVNGFGSFASMVGVSSVSTLLGAVGWRGVFRTGAAMAGLAALALLPTLRRPGKGGGEAPAEQRSPGRASGKAKTE